MFDYLLRIKQPCIFRAFMNEINWGKASRSTKQWISGQQCKDSIDRGGRKSSTLILIINQLLCNFMFKQPIGVRTVRFIFFSIWQFVSICTQSHWISSNPRAFMSRNNIFSKNQSVFRNARSVVWLIEDLSDYSQSFLSLWHSDPKPWEPKSEVNWCIWNTV